MKKSLVASLLLFGAPSIRAESYVQDPGCYEILAQVESLDRKNLELKLRIYPGSRSDEVLSITLDRAPVIPLDPGRQVEALIWTDEKGAAANLRFHAARSEVHLRAGTSFDSRHMWRWAGLPVNGQCAKSRRK